MGDGPLGEVRQLIARADAAWERESWAVALEDLEEVLRRHPDFADVRNRAGFCRAMLDDLDGALEHLDHALEVNPDYVQAHLNRALVLNTMGRFDEAVEAFERARELDHRVGEGAPVDLGNRLAMEHAKIGDLYVRAEQPGAAVDEYRKALEMRPQFVDIRTRLADAFLMLGQVPEAIAELEGVVSEHPSFLGARLRLGVALHYDGRTDEAVEHWRRCLEVDPKDLRARGYLRSAGVDVQDVDPEGAEEEDA